MGLTTSRPSTRTVIVRATGGPRNVLWNHRQPAAGGGPGRAGRPAPHRHGLRPAWDGPCAGSRARTRTERPRRAPEPARPGGRRPGRLRFARELERLRSHPPGGQPDRRRPHVGPRPGPHQRPPVEPGHRRVHGHPRAPPVVVLRLPDPAAQRTPGGGRWHGLQGRQHRHRRDAVLRLGHEHVDEGPVPPYPALVPDGDRAAGRPDGHASAARSTTPASWPTWPSCTTRPPTRGPSCPAWPSPSPWASTRGPSWRPTARCS